MTQKISEIPCQERPRERLIKFGAESLADAELLSIILNSGGPDVNAVNLSQNLLAEFGNVHDLIYSELTQLKQVKYLGVAKSCRIKAVGELCKRAISLTEPNQLPMNSAENVYSLIRPYILGKKVECLYVLSLDLSNRLIKLNLLSSGTISQSLADIREILRSGLINNAISIVLVHNHPSGSLIPSQDDKNLTERLSKACFLAGLVLLDHVIATENSYFSFKNHGISNLPRKGVRL